MALLRAGLLRHPGIGDRLILAAVICTLYLGFINIRGFNQNQLGFTLDGVPLGDMSYGNTNGLHISRAILWVRAQAAVEGWSTLPESLRLVHGLLERFWDELHPRPDPDDGDAYARINALAGAPGPLTVAIDGFLTRALVRRP